MKKLLMLSLIMALTLVVSLGFAQTAQPKKEANAKAANVKVDTCYECHDTVSSLHKGSIHGKINCVSCHTGLETHLADSEKRPTIDLTVEACGSCHNDQMKSFLALEYHRPARDDKSQPTGRAPIWYDKLMAPHGFTKEHNVTRGHAVMLLDQFVVDRAFGGRFQPKDGWEYVLQSGKVWDILYDIDPASASKGQKKFLPETATAANPVCMSCKTADHSLDMAYLGDPGKGAKWDRTSNVVELAKSVDNSLNCIFCHDPHSAKPRIIQDALIAALDDPNGDTLWHRDPNRTKINVIEMGERGFTRKIAILEKPDSQLMCAQCHVEYNCNPGTNPDNGSAIGFSSPLTNHFPMVNVLELYDHYYNKVKFGDFKHKITGALLWKGQHPETETYWNSKHDMLGVGCADCHFETVKDKKGKKVYTSHFAESPKYMDKSPCLNSGCHVTWTAEQAKYTIDSVKSYTKGRMRKAEYWLAMMIDRYQDAKMMGVDESVLKEVRVQHSKAHILWEYWTAENSDGFHNPSLARESLTKSIEESMKGIDMLDKAIAEKTASKTAATK